MFEIVLPKILNSIGILCDMVGACLVAWEVVQQYNGKQLQNINPLHPVSFIPAPEKTPKYEKWEKNKYTKMKIGLGFLLIGFLLQFISNWIYIPNLWMSLF